MQASSSFLLLTFLLGSLQVDPLFYMKIRIYSVCLYRKDIRRKGGERRTEWHAKKITKWFAAYFSTRQIFYFIFQQTPVKNEEEEKIGLNKSIYLISCSKRPVC